MCAYYCTRIAHVIHIDCITDNQTIGHGLHMASFQKLPSGRWRGQVRRAGASLSRTFDSKTEAQDWAKATEVAVKQRAVNGAIDVPAAMLLEQAIEAYLKAVNIKPANQASLRAFGKALPNLALRDLNDATMQRWINHRLNQGVVGATISHNIGLVSGMLKWLRHNRHLKVDLTLAKNARASLSAAKIQTTSQERDRYITDKEIEAFKVIFSEQDKLKLPMNDLMEFALASGMRLGEICRITHEDYSHNEGVVVVRDRKDPKRKEGNHMRVPLSSKARAIIGKQPTKVGRIFPFRTNSVSSAWIAARQLADIEDVTFHDLRHRAITDLFARGLTIEQVALISGHKTWAQLRRYTQTQPNSIVDLLG